MPEIEFPPAESNDRGLTNLVCKLLEQKFPGYHLELDLFHLYFFQGSGIGRVARSRDMVNLREWLNSLLDPLNRLLFGNAAVLVSSNPFFGTAVRLRWGRDGKPDRALVRGIIPNTTLRRVVLPVLTIALLIGWAVKVLPAIKSVPIPILLATLLPCVLLLPACHLLARLLARPLTSQVAAAFDDAAACEAAGLMPLPVRC
jgi:hypothetical protein